MPHSTYSKKTSFHLLEGTMNFFWELKKVKNGRNRSQISKKFEKIRDGLNGILRGPGKADLWKNLKLKIPLKAPFKGN
jgi:hypothetical protein